jgi:hypothetical protein
VQTLVLLRLKRKNLFLTNIIIQNLRSREGLGSNCIEQWLAAFDCDLKRFTQHMLQVSLHSIQSPALFLVVHLSGATATVRTNENLLKP